MLTAERRNAIRELLFAQGSIRVSELVERFEISEETARRDLSELEREGVAEKNYGGATLAKELQHIMSSIPNVQQRKIEHLDEKKAIAAKAAGLVQDGQTVLIDAGSTTWCLLQQLKRFSRLTIVTNSVDIAYDCAGQDDWDVHMTGGRLNQRSMSLIGPDSERAIRSYNADICFLGASGVAMEKGFTSAGIFEAQVKRVMAESAPKTVVLVGSSAFAAKGLHTFLSFADVSEVFTTSRLGEKQIKQLRANAVKVTVCPCP